MNKKTTVKAIFPIDIRTLANALTQRQSPRFVIAMLKKNPEEAEIAVHRILRDYFRAIKAELTIPSLTFSHLDSENVSHAGAHFNLTLHGTRKEIAEVLGEGKFIFKSSSK